MRSNHAAFVSTLFATSLLALGCTPKSDKASFSGGNEQTTPADAGKEEPKKDAPASDDASVAKTDKPAPAGEEPAKDEAPAADEKQSQDQNQGSDDKESEEPPLPVPAACNDQWAAKVAASVVGLKAEYVETTVVTKPEAETSTYAYTHTVKSAADAAIVTTVAYEGEEPEDETLSKEDYLAECASITAAQPARAALTVSAGTFEAISIKVEEKETTWENSFESWFGTDALGLLLKSVNYEKDATDGENYEATTTVELKKLTAPSN